MSYDCFKLEAEAKPAILKGHQIIGELRLLKVVTTSGSPLKGHQIIGELRPSRVVLLSPGCIERSPDHW